MKQSRWYCHNCKRQWYPSDNVAGSTNPFDPAEGCIICHSPRIEYVTYTGRFPGDDYLSDQELPCAVEDIPVLPESIARSKEIDIVIPNKTLELAMMNNSIDEQSEVTPEMWDFLEKRIEARASDKSIEKGSIYDLSDMD